MNNFKRIALLSTFALAICNTSVRAETTATTEVTEVTTEATNSIETVTETTEVDLHKVENEHLKIANNEIQEKHRKSAEKMRKEMESIKRKEAAEKKKREEEKRFKSIGYGFATVYNNKEDQYGAQTANGIRSVNRETIAVDPSVIPYGSIVKVTFQDGNSKKYKAIDCGGMIHGTHIDIYVEDMPQSWINSTKYKNIKLEVDSTNAKQNLRNWRRYGI